MKNIFLFLLILCGCSGKQPLGGRVTFSDDNTPITKGVVFFSTPTFYAQGAIKPDGSYTVGTDRMSDGLPKGEYAVYIAGTEMIEFGKNKQGHPVEKRTRLIDPKYEKPETSGLTFLADGKNRKFDISVERAKTVNKK